ncbi:scytonemin biosynthesis cyclase/decarboxylase ScyC [Tolypothrix sp. VBCCA 56010]|uniref:scytonemin biosynthesis cyclase/decarboxylase ScyC n=1 Tax=Tolypothrix sp. VBCCA 56010 TaxID=3137731 RepID=UPI003D7E1141
MEKNTFATSAYIANSLENTYEYLCSLKNLDEWTLYSRMAEQMDEDTWRGSASGYHRDLYYHVKKLQHSQLQGIEWHCGLEYQKYFQVYPVLLFPSDYIEPGTDENGVYFHWLSFVDPKRQTQMIMQGIHTVHTSECRSLKANLERKAGLTSAEKGRYFIDTDTIYVDAPIEVGVAYLSDLRNMNDWAHLVRPDGETSALSGEYRDEYGHKVKVSLRVEPVSKWYLVEHEFFYPEQGFYQRCPSMLIPASYAFGDPEAPGFILHRITFWKHGEQLPLGKLQIEDFGAENMNIKRLTEAKAGNLQSFDRGQSYAPLAK